MDNITVDLGPARGCQAAARRAGDPDRLQRGERITAEEVARRLDTINYEITCGLTPRVPRDLPPRRPSGAGDAVRRAIA